MDELQAQFDEVRKERVKRFHECYIVVHKKIDSIYKDLTRSLKSPSGGNASIDLENKDEP